jgi:hypothetical protein
MSWRPSVSSPLLFTLLLLAPCAPLSHTGRDSERWERLDPPGQSVTTVLRRCTWYGAVVGSRTSLWRMIMPCWSRGSGREAPLSIPDSTVCSSGEERGVGVGSCSACCCNAVNSSRLPHTVYAFDRTQGKQTAPACVARSCLMPVHCIYVGVSPLALSLAAYVLRCCLPAVVRAAELRP